MNDARRKELEGFARFLKSARAGLEELMNREIDVGQCMLGGVRNPAVLKSLAATCEINEAISHCAAAINNINNARMGT